MSLRRDEEQELLDVYLEAVTEYSASVAVMRKAAGKNKDVEFLAALEQVRLARSKAHDARLRFNAFVEGTTLTRSRVFNAKANC